MMLPRPSLVVQRVEDEERHDDDDIRICLPLRRCERERRQNRNGEATLGHLATSRRSGAAPAENGNGERYAVWGVENQLSRKLKLMLTRGASLRLGSTP